MRERVLVTGGAGFVGHHLVHALLEEGHDVLAVDTFDLGRRSHFADLPQGGTFRLEEIDIRDEAALCRVVSAFQPQLVYHLAALHFIPYCVAHPKETLDVNVNGTETLCRALRLASPRSVVFTSSAAYYGFSDEPLPESAPANPVDIYGLSKWLGEGTLRRLSADRPELRTVIARLFNVYGQCETNPHVIPDLLGRLNGTAEAVVELGNVWPLRDYVHVSDVVRALRLLADGAAGLEVCNIAGGAGHTVADLVAEIGRATGHDIEIRHDPSRARKSDGHLVADLVRIGQQYGWKPSHNLRSGLDDLVGNPHGHSTAELIGG